jgi:hypothetical protein
MTEIEKKAGVVNVEYKDYANNPSDAASSGNA